MFVFESWLWESGPGADSLPHGAMQAFVAWRGARARPVLRPILVAGVLDRPVKYHLVQALLVAQALLEGRARLQAWLDF